MNPLYRLLSFIAPDDCIVCGLEGSLLCEACRQAELLPSPSSCFRCGKRTVDYLTCKNCRRQTKLYALRVCVLFDGCARELVHITKYQPRRGGIDVIASVMSEKNIAPIDVITHCPTSANRIRTRSFDHARLLAKQIAQANHSLYAPLLVRRKNTHQVGASRAERFRYAKEAYDVKSAHLVHNKHVLLIDDVYTTGATVMAAAELLKNAGARRVSALVFAH